MNRNVLVNDLNNLLNITQFSDYGPNGLQVEGSSEIKKIAFAVSATRDSIEKAVALKVDALIVHHGLFWKFHGPRPITKAFYKRIAPLIKNDINLIGYHLPLDGHIRYGNAASIAQRLGLKNLSGFGEYKGATTGVWGKFEKELTSEELKNKLEEVLNHSIIHSKADSNLIESLAIITGGANSQWKECLDYEIDAYVTGEISEHDWHEAKESGVHYFAGGHNATEQFGVQELLKYIHDKYQKENLELFFIPSENPA